MWISSGGRRRLRTVASTVIAAALAACPASQVGKVAGPGELAEAAQGARASGEQIDGESTARATSPGARAVDAGAGPAGAPDRDGDRVVDVDDPCPDLAEIMNGFEDDDGCPDDPPRLIVEPTVDPSPVPPVSFAAGSARLAPESYPGLDAVAQLMRDHPEVVLVELQGHVDGKERGARLDVARAEAVRAYLVARGVDAARFAVKGLGATRPLDPARTDAARARNRRVEMTVALRIDEPEPVTP
jgi:outer membrane protein OmpA-like peptidoglycan-associated protein